MMGQHCELSLGALVSLVSRWTRLCTIIGLALSSFSYTECFAQSDPSDCRQMTCRKPDQECPRVGQCAPAEFDRFEAECFKCNFTNNQGQTVHKCCLYLSEYYKCRERGCNGGNECGTKIIRNAVHGILPNSADCRKFIDLRDGFTETTCGEYTIRISPDGKVAIVTGPELGVRYVAPKKCGERPESLILFVI